MWLHQSMMAYLNPGRLARDVLVALLCALLLFSSASARSRNRSEVTLPGAEGHPNGDYGATLASIGQSTPSSMRVIVLSIGYFRFYWIHVLTPGRTSVETERVGRQGTSGTAPDIRGGSR